MDLLCALREQAHGYHKLKGTTNMVWDRTFTATTSTWAIGLPSAASPRRQLPAPASQAPAHFTFNSLPRSILPSCHHRRFVLATSLSSATAYAASRFPTLPHESSARSRLSVDDTFHVLERPAGLQRPFGLLYLSHLIALVARVARVALDPT
ncbi:hypothetical protein E4U53_000957 [Claviceps sorghi]|nr:hypothetical protein E4U53_000957 [Claviceps sorghi]